MALNTRNQTVGSEKDTGFKKSGKRTVIARVTAEIAGAGGSGGCGGEAVAGVLGVGATLNPKP